MNIGNERKSGSREVPEGLLAKAGEALYGPRWQSDLARDLGVNIRTVQRWAAGVVDAPQGIYGDLLRLTQDRAAALDALAERLAEGAGST